MTAAPASQLHVTVVGAGILGSSIAMHLAQRGCKVRVLEAADRPAHGGASRVSWAWLNANWKEPLHYRDLNAKGMEEWRRFPELADFPGCLALGDSRPENPAYPSESLSGEQLRAMEPNLAPELSEAGARLYAQEGIAYLAPACQHFLAMAEAESASLHFNEAVQGFDSTEGRVSGVVTSSGRYTTDVVVLAAGLGIPKLAEEVLGSRVPLISRPKTWVLLTEPLQPLLKHLLLGADVFIAQRRDGRLLISPYRPATGPPEDLPASEALPHILRLATQLLPDLPALLSASSIPAGPEGSLEGSPEGSRGSYLVPQLGVRPYPADGHPIMGWLPGFSNVYVAVTHSGATLGPLLGRLVAAEVAAGEQCPELEPYRPTRDFSAQSYLY